MSSWQSVWRSKNRLRHAGPEICVISTKAAISQMVLISRLAAELAFLKGRISVQARQRLLRDLLLLPERVKEVVARQANLRRLAERYGHRHNCESALKLKEVTYLHCGGDAGRFLETWHAFTDRGERSISCFLFLPQKKKAFFSLP